MKRRIFLRRGIHIGAVLCSMILVMLFCGAARAQTCPSNNNSDFSISGSSGNTVSSTMPLPAGSYTLGVIVNMPGVSNSGVTCYPVTVTGQPAGGAASITVNGLSSGATVSVGTPLSVAVSNGPGNTTDWIGICLGAPSMATCDGAGYNWSYLNCQQTPPTTALTSATCSLTAPNAANTYRVNFFQGASTNTGGALPGSILPPCPRGCTWTNIYNEDFTTATSFDYAFNPDPVNGHPGTFDTSHKWEIPPDGSVSQEVPSGTTACSAMIDASTLTGGGSGYLSIHAVGTIPWETAGTMVCTEMAPVAGAAGAMPGTVPGGCGFDCQALTHPVYFEVKVWPAANQIFESTISNICTKGTQGQSPYCPLTTRPSWMASNLGWQFLEARGNNTDIGGHDPQILNDANHAYIYGPNEGWFQNGSGLLSPSPHVVGVLIDPTGPMSNYWDGQQDYVGDPDNCATGPTTTCYFNIPVSPWWFFDWGTMTGTTGGTSKLYFVRAYQGM